MVLHACFQYNNNDTRRTDVIEITLMMLTASDSINSQENERARDFLCVCVCESDDRILCNYIENQLSGPCANVNVH